MEYLKNKEYDVKYLDSDGKTKEIKLKPSEDMSTPKLIKKLQNEDDKFVKLLEGKLFGKPITTYKVSFYVDDDETPYDEILEKTENALKNTGLASYIDKIEIEEYKVMDESKELITEDVGDFITSGKGFYIGDPGYVLSDDVYYGIWYEKYNFKNGKINVDGKLSFIVHRTAYGDGEYFDGSGFSYGVDSGTLAIIPLELIKETEIEPNEGKYEYGRIVFGTTGSLEYADGVFTFRIDSKDIIVIDTDPAYDDYDNEELEESKTNKEVSKIKEEKELLLEDGKSIKEKLIDIIEKDAEEEDYYFYDKSEWDNLSFEEKFDEWQSRNYIEDYFDELGIETYNESLQLSDNHVLSFINNKYFDQLDPESSMMWYWTEVDNWLSTFEIDMQDKGLLEGEVSYDGRSSRHIVIDNCLTNILNYNELKEAYNELEAKFIDYINNYEGEEDY